MRALVSGPEVLRSRLVMSALRSPPSSNGLAVTQLAHRASVASHGQFQPGPGIPLALVWVFPSWTVPIRACHTHLSLGISGPHLLLELSQPRDRADSALQSLTSVSPVPYPGLFPKPLNWYPFHVLPVISNPMERSAQLPQLSRKPFTTAIFH